MPVQLGSWLYLFVVGFAYDLAALLYFAGPMVLYLWLVPTRAYVARPLRTVLGALCLVYVYVLLFVAAAEWLFWDEFGSRFNFVAVDYLVYSREVLSNIRDSYPVGKLLSLLGLIAALIVYLTRGIWSPCDSGSRFRDRTAVTLVWLVLTVAVTGFLDSADKNRSSNAFVNELAGNGIYEFFSAYRNNQLDYERLYRTLPDAEAFSKVRTLLQTPDARFIDNDQHDIARAISASGPERHLNVVLISVESLSGEFLATFGNTKNITPNLDKLASKSLFFSSLYASGTRTVRGLEALVAVGSADAG